MKNQQQQIVCALYTRVSSRNQLEKDYSSLETQRERLEAYCKSQDNYSIHRVYEDGAYSAETLDRPALKQMLADIQAGKVNCVLAYKIDRLTRSVKDFHLLMDLFDRYKVKFVSITQSIDTQHPMGRLLRNVLLDFAQFEREMTADRTRDKMHQRAQKGMWNGGGVPYGYRNENKRLVKDEVEAPRVQFIFQFFAQNPSLAHLRSELQRRDWLTRAGRLWIKSALDYLLKNPVYIGKLPFNKQQYQSDHAPLVDEAVFNKVQTLRPKRTHVATVNTRPFLLKGLLTCSDCGSLMSPHYTQKRHKDGSVYRIPYYRCTRTMKYSNQVCRIKHMNADQVEQAVIQHLADLGQDRATLDASIDELNRDLRGKVGPWEQEAAQAKARIRKLDAEIDNLVAAVAKGSLSVEKLEKAMQTRETDRKALQARYDDLQLKINQEAATEFNAELVRRNLQDFQSVFAALSPEERAEAVQCLVKQITAFPDKLVVDVYEAADFSRASCDEACISSGSTNRTKWLPR